MREVMPRFNSRDKPMLAKAKEQIIVFMIFYTYYNIESNRF